MMQTILPISQHTCKWNAILQDTRQQVQIPLFCWRKNFAKMYTSSSYKIQLYNIFNIDTSAIHMDNFTRQEFILLLISLMISRIFQVIFWQQPHEDESNHWMYIIYEKTSKIFKNYTYCIITKLLHTWQELFRTHSPTPHTLTSGKETTRANATHITHTSPNQKNAIQTKYNKRIVWMFVPL